MTGVADAVMRWLRGAQMVRLLLVLSAIVGIGSGRSRAACVGDCDGSADVTVNELIAMVDIVLGDAQSSPCSGGDAGSEDITTIIAAVNNALSGCPPSATPTPSLTPLPTATPTPGIGPIVSAFGIADGSGTFNTAVDSDIHGRPVFVRPDAAGFIIYVEGRPGQSHFPVGTDRLTARPGDPTRQPDLQIESSNDLGDGSVAVCDNSYPRAGGVPAVSPVDFSPVQPVSDALNDLSCRFKMYGDTDFACTQNSGGDFQFADPSSTVQFCTLVSDLLTLPRGETVLTARLLDTAGNAGPAMQIVVRVTGGSAGSGS